MVSRTYTKRHILKLDNNICAFVSSENGIETLTNNEITLIKLSHFNFLNKFLSQIYKSTIELVYISIKLNPCLKIFSIKLTE